MRASRILLPVIAAWLWTGAGASAQQVHPSDIPLIGTWILSQKDHGACDEKRTFAEHTQVWRTDGQVVKAPGTYAKSGDTIYVQQRTGSGETVAFLVVSPNEIMDTLGTNACHWTRQ